MLLDIAIIVFLMVAAILLILAEIFLLPGITLSSFFLLEMWNPSIVPASLCAASLPRQTASP